MPGSSLVPTGEWSQLTTSKLGANYAFFCIHLWLWLRSEAQEEMRGEEADERGEGGGKDERGDKPPAREHVDEVGVEGDGAGDEAEGDWQEGGAARPADAACEEEGQGDEDAEGVCDEEDGEVHGWLVSPGYWLLPGCSLRISLQRTIHLSQT